MKDLRLADGRDRLVRHGHGPARTIQTGIGAVEVARVKVRDRAAVGDGERIRFTSNPAAVGAAHEEPGRPFAGALLSGHLDGRLPGGRWQRSWARMRRIFLRRTVRPSILAAWALITSSNR
jgi:hypothetical protein